MARKTPWQQTLSQLVSERRAPPGGRRGLAPKPYSPGGPSRLAKAGFPLLAIALVAALAVGILFLWPGGPAQAQESATIEYAENGKDPVATLTATDPEMDTVTWTVADAGAGTLDFEIDGDDGVLEFINPPDFEAPTGGDANDSNTYMVTVTATDTATPTPNTDTFTVTVKVTNVDEVGKVTWGVDHDSTTYDSTTYAPAEADTPTLVQFQVGDILSVAATGGVTDGDVLTATKEVTERLQWYRSPSKTAMGTAIDGATSASYRVMTEDIGMYIRVMAFYNVGTGREESASRTSDYPVLGSRTSNDAPEFDPAMITREVSEGKKGMTVGAPVRATDDIANALNYTLAGADAARFEIDQKTGQIKTLVDLDREGDAVAVAGTLGSCADATADTPDPECTVTVTATDSAGADSTAATVTIKITNVDEKPTFGATGNPKSMMVAENNTALSDTDANVTYAATDEDGINLTWSLMGADGAKFQLSGSQVLSFREKPDYEMPADANRDNVYEVTVRASDGTMHADRMVRVTVTDADEAPEIMGRDSVNFAENGKDPVATFTAEDPEGATPIAWSLATATQVGAEGDLADTDNADAASFGIDEDGMLKFSSPPDFENPAATNATPNTYKVVVVACDTALVSDACPASPDGQAGYHKVTVKVTNVAETGKVTWTTAADGSTVDTPTLVQFQVGSLLTATATDDDISGATKTVTDADHNLTWQWHRGSARITGTDAEDNTYTVTTSDVGSRLRATAFYTVGTGREESASRTSDYPVLGSRTSNDAPEFDPAMITREVSEGKKGMTVGAPVRATDDIANALNYTLAGADAARFEIDQKTGQIKTLVDLDREGDAVAVAGTLGSCADATADTPDPECTVTVTATDSAGADSTAATVTIKITNVDEKPTFGATGNPKSMMVAENNTALSDTDANVTYAATDEDGINLTWSLMGADGAKFQLSGSQVLSFREKPDYEMPADANRDNVYEVTVRASDGTMHADRMVRVTVTDVNEAPMILGFGLNVSGSRSVDYPENGMDAVGTYTASGPEAASASWTLEGDDAGDFKLSSSSGMSTMLMFRSSPDYEMPADANTDNVYMVTLKAMEGEDMDTQDVTVTVTNMDDDGVVTLMPMSPVVGNEVNATLTDPDGGVSGESWQWSKSMTMMDEDFMVIDGETMKAYTPVEADNGYHLRATVTYTDGHGPEKTAMNTTGMVVSNNVPVFAAETASRMIAENSAAGTPVGDPVMATDADADDMLTYALSGTDDMYFAIDNMGQITVGEGMMLDYEMPRGEAMTDTNTNDYMVTVTVKDDSGAANDSASIDVTIMVTNVDEAGMVALSSTTPALGVELTATLSDGDGGVTETTWQWSRSKSMDGEFADITGATSEHYTPVTIDVGDYLMAKAMYTDALGEGKMAMSKAVGPVSTEDPKIDLLARYDANDNGQIDKNEVIKAINDYLFGTGEDDAITKEQVIMVINLYLFGNSGS